MNAEIRQFRDTLVTLINSSPIPIEVKRMVIAEISNAVSVEAERAIMQEKEQKEKENKENEQNITE